jgi:hypothetical protein
MGIDRLLREIARNSSIHEQRGYADRLDLPTTGFDGGSGRVGAILNGDGLALEQSSELEIALRVCGRSL